MLNADGRSLLEPWTLRGAGCCTVVSTLRAGCPRSQHRLLGMLSLGVTAGRYKVEITVRALDSTQIVQSN